MWGKLSPALLIAALSLPPPIPPLALTYNAHVLCIYINVFIFFFHQSFTQGFAPAPPAVDNSAQLRADAEKELDSVLLQIEKRRRDLEHIESDVNVAKEKQHKADDELKDAKEVLSKLRDEASKLEVHHKKMKIKQKRVEKQVQKAENVENEKSEKEKVEASIKLYSFNEYVSNSVYTLSPQLITGGGGGGHHLPKKNPKKARGDEAPLALSSRGRRTLLLFNC